jgi:hypothetical protein
MREANNRSTIVTGNISENLHRDPAGNWIATALPTMWQRKAPGSFLPGAGVKHP